MCFFFDLCIMFYYFFSSNMASAVAQGSDSHDAPLLFVLPCESSVQLCLPLSFLSARCLRGKVSLFSLLSSTELSHSFIHSLIPIGPCCPFLSLPSLVSCCVFTFLLIRNETLLHSFVSFFALCPHYQTTPHYCPFSVTLMLLFWSHYCLLSLNAYQ